MIDPGHGLEFIYISLESTHTSGKLKRKNIYKVDQSHTCYSSFIVTSVTTKSETRIR